MLKGNFFFKRFFIWKANETISIEHIVSTGAILSIYPFTSFILNYTLGLLFLLAQVIISEIEEFTTITFEAYNIAMF